MLKSHEKFHSANGKRLILVVDDEMINREMMGLVLQNDYEVIFAEDGLQAMDLIEQHREMLSLVLLDLMMPVMPGKEVLRQIKANPSYRHIPVIVLTADAHAEIEILNLGAADFIPKPYPEAGVILARILRTIELYEDRQIIQSTERDPLTGLYNREYFYSYAEQYDQHHRTVKMDALVVDVNHFHMINERFGNAYGDEVLKHIGEKLRESISDNGGIVCRREADTFMVYCPHGKDYKAILENASFGLAGDDSANNRVRLRMGVYADVDKNMDVERRFDRAKMAADTVRNSLIKTIGMYDRLLHEREMYAEQLIEDFPTAISECQFQVYYQPKFDIRPEIPVLTSAEALIRWIHPKLGMISPGIFIPLFEENGLIQTLDNYVWRTAAAQIRDWKDRLGFSVPVSVNVSRIDMYDPMLVDALQHILAVNRLTPEDLHLEITESAYTQDSEQIIEMVNELRFLGFCIEMDDFGTGYSSLNMISTLPIDALKLDMQFIRSAFGEHKDTRMLELIIDIADYLAVPVIAEGVETEEQLTALRAMGCDVVQGYYFSPPVPSSKYEDFMIERRDMMPTDVSTAFAYEKHVLPSALRHYDTDFEKIAYALSNSYESVYYVDTESNHYVEFSSEGKYSDLQIQRSGKDFFADVQTYIPHVHPEDQEHVSKSLEKETLLNELAGEQPYTVSCRLMIEGNPTLYAFKIVRADNRDDHHIVIGVSNVNDQIDLPEDSSEQNSVDFASLAQALTSDMESLYYIDTLTDTYQEYMSSGAYAKLHLEANGKHFFEECRRNIAQAVYPDDQEKVCAALGKEELLLTLSKRRSFCMDYRLMVDGEPVFYRLKAILAGKKDDHHIIICVSNIDSHITENQKLDVIRQSTATFSRIAQALAEDYFSIYYVDTKTDGFIEYSSYSEYSGLGIAHSGSDFFNLSRSNMQQACFPEDLPQFLAAFTKANVMKELERNGVFTINYRLFLNGNPTYVHMKVTRMGDRHDPHIVVGISNIDAQMRRELKYEQELRAKRQDSYRDSLTGVKSKHAYADIETQYDEAISRGRSDNFAVVVCDINDLQKVNESQGRSAGDELIRSSCHEICKVFNHSPVYRYGSDEFVVLLKGHDYKNRTLLMNLIATKNQNRLQGGGPLIASGMAEYRPGEDQDIASVFKRADKAMRADKRQLKEQKAM